MAVSTKKGEMDMQISYVGQIEIRPATLVAHVAPPCQEQLVELETAVEEAKAKILPSLLEEYEVSCRDIAVVFWVHRAA